MNYCKNQYEERMAAVVAALVGTVQFACLIEELDYPDCRQDVLTALIGKLSELEGGQKVCATEGACKRDAACEDSTCGEWTLPRCVGFGAALDYLKDGRKVARMGWNGKRQYVELAERISYRNVAGDTIHTDHEHIGSKALAFVGTSGVQLGWLASQADMLAEDWYVVE